MDTCTQPVRKAAALSWVSQTHFMHSGCFRGCSQLNNIGNILTTRGPKAGGTRTDWVEHVLATGGAPHLKTSEHRLSWPAAHSLDVAALAAGAAALLALLVIPGARFTLAALRPTLPLSPLDSAPKQLDCKGLGAAAAGDPALTRFARHALHLPFFNVSDPELLGIDESASEQPNCEQLGATAGEGQVQESREPCPAAAAVPLWKAGEMGFSKPPRKKPKPDQGISSWWPPAGRAGVLDGHPRPTGHVAVRMGLVRRAKALARMGSAGGVGAGDARAYCEACGGKAPGIPSLAASAAARR